MTFTLLYNRRFDANFNYDPFILLRGGGVEIILT